MALVQDAVFKLSCALIISAGAAAVKVAAQDLAIAVEFGLHVDANSKLYRYALPHPCGKVLTLRSNRIPVDLPIFNVYWAYELAEGGDVLMKWPLPADATPVAISGDRLTIRMATSQELVYLSPPTYIGLPLEGDLPSEPNLAHPQHVACPAASDDTISLDTYFCAALPGKVEQETRIIAYPPVCT